MQFTEKNLSKKVIAGSTRPQVNLLYLQKKKKKKGKKRKEKRNRNAILKRSFLIEDEIEDTRKIKKFSFKVLVSKNQMLFTD